MSGEDRNMGKSTLACLVVFVIALMGGLIAGIIVGITRDDIGLKKERHGKLEDYVKRFDPMAGPGVPGPDDYWWDSGSGQYKYAAVAADDPTCSEIGTEIMAQEGGGAVDAAIAAMFCLGVVNPVANGMGGGMFMTLYDRPNNESRSAPLQQWVFNARETAPAAATEDMFAGDEPPSSVRGGMAIGVPGEVLGMYEAWRMFGRVPWRRLVEPSVELARYGYRISGYVAEFIDLDAEEINDNDEMKAVFMPKGEKLVEGDTGIRPKLANTLEKLAENPLAMYDPNDKLCQDIVADIKEAGGIVTAQDMGNYTVSIKKPLSIQIDDRFTLITMPPPSSGIIVGTILKVLSAFEFDADSVATVENATLTYQRIVETFKLAYAERSKLGDSDFVNNSAVLDDLLSDAGIEKMRAKINETMTQPLDYYQAAYGDLNDLGTNHLSVYGGNGGAVALTSSINYDFGSMVLGSRTGIIFNDHMDDFGIPGKSDVWGFPAAPNNLIAPGKRPMSSMSPSIVLNQDGDAVLVTGGTGGSKIITTIAQSIIKALWFDWDAKQVVDDPRIHHQLIPHQIEREEGFNRGVLIGLEKKGHVVDDEFISGVYVTTNQLIKNTCGLCSDNDTKCHDECGIQAASDGRRSASPAGF